MKNLLAAFAVTLLPGLSQAQTYWQQEVNYKIAVSLNDDKHELSGTEEIEYVNHSPDQLTYIYFHLWPNAYKNTKTALAKQMVVNGSRKLQFAKKEQRGYISNLAFEVNGRPARLEYEQEDIGKLILNEPLKPGEKITIKTPFVVKVPGAFSRLGHVAQSYQITQWYPKPAVYDRKGWHPMPYLDQGEFYSEFGKFDVKITLPENYTVGATGELQTASELRRLDSLARVTAQKSSFGNDMTFPASSAKTKTLHYVQNNIHDFAWFADKRFNVLKDTVELPESKRPVITWQMFLNKNADGWLKSKNDINEAVYYYSKHVGEYPYSAATAVDGALGENVGGMEYPMVTVTSPSAIIHEVGHNWFYGILASDERQHPWMDEGLNSYVESRIDTDKNTELGKKDGSIPAGLRRHFGLENVPASITDELLYQVTASRGNDQPIEYHAADYFKLNYGGIVYQKSTMVFKYLAAYLGQERFDKAMQTYFEEWKFKHPYPEDFQRSFEKSTGENLDWFFSNIIKTTKPVDVEIKSEDAGPTGRMVTIKNESGYPVAVPVAAFDAQGQKLEQHWTKPFSGTETIAFATTQAEKYVIDPDYVVPELKRRDNQLKTSGLFKKSKRFRLQKLAGIEQYDKKQLYFLPVIGANTADKFMLGAAFYNSSLLYKRVNFLVMPMYSFHENEVNGIGNINYNLVARESKWLRQALIGFNFQRFEYFEKYEPSLTLNFKRKSGRSPRQQLKLAITNINQAGGTINEILEPASTDNLFRILHQPEDIGGQTMTYTYSQKSALQDLGFELQFQHLGSDPKKSDNQSNALRGAIQYKRYWSKDKNFNVRLFGGKFFTQGEVPFYMGLSGSPDYLKETIFLDRAQKSDGIRALADQTDMRDGAFKNFIPVFSDDWMSTLNLETDIPYFPLSAYLDLGKAGGYDDLFYGTGLALNIGEGFFSLYLPIAGSNFVNDTPEDFKDFKQNIRFSLRFNMLNPFKALNEAL
ncbi:hypothetical protein I5M27_01730 [Adhaeribacter sp. BT258]|uniref:Peptidase M1 membrane alanine aminopeptidase domain-containing protein n=1 Tax=Adhaeribacter terrigena TaxID=2793070 RepID=A0ABS1BX94_9BACT|nr:M1 family metallopeptidase [Adhaeribacter terrigena]MBK0401685.1 hypothetical protein [Adhaeribacter terrigena]